MNIEEILNDEESLKDLKDLADMLFTSGEETAHQNSRNHGENVNFCDEQCEDGVNDAGSGFDWTILFKLQSIFAEYNKEDANTKLLKSIEPFLSGERRVRAEKAAKIIKLVSVAQMLKENGMLDDLI
jgi:hypothetical protein